jgi:hypothetical protein
MKEVLFAACLAHQVAFESGGAGDFTSRMTPILRNGIQGLSNLELETRIREAFGAGARQTPELDCAPERRTLPLFGLAVAPVNSADQFARFERRLGEIEKRLDRLGA